MNILFLVDTYFPNGVAFSARAVSFCRLLHHLGHNVHVITAHSQEMGVIPETVYMLDTCTYECATTQKMRSVESFTGLNAFYKCVIDYIKDHEVDAIFASACPQYFSKLRKMCNATGIPLYLEQCEWYDSSNFRFGRLDPRYIRIAHLINKEYCKADGIVAISRLLENHYLDLCSNVIRIPTILGVQSIPSRVNTSHSDTKLHIVYTGNCGVSKELLKPAIEGLVMDSTLRSRITFQIFGPDEATVMTNIGFDRAILTRAGDSVVLHGKLPQKEIQGVLMNADYQLFLRPGRRSSNAGFPTKLGESMSVGTPVITNDTGDIGLYVIDGVNGFLLREHTAKAVNEALHRIIQSSSKDRSDMRKAARATAETSFDYQVYSDKMRNLLMEKRINP